MLPLRVRKEKQPQLLPTARAGAAGPSLQQQQQQQQEQQPFLWLRHVPHSVRWFLLALALLQLANVVAFWTFERTALAVDTLRVHEVRLCNSQDRCSDWPAGELDADALRAAHLYEDLMRVEVPAQSVLAVFAYTAADLLTATPALVFAAGEHICAAETCKHVVTVRITDKVEVVDLADNVRMCDGDRCVYLQAYDALSRDRMQAEHSIAQLDEIDVPDGLVVVVSAQSGRVLTVLPPGEWLCGRATVCDGAHLWRVYPADDVVNSVEHTAAMLNDDSMRREWVQTFQSLVTQKTTVVVHSDAGDQAPRADDVTLVTQLSVSRLSRLVAMAEGWNGPISAVIYLTNPWDMFTLVLFWNQLITSGTQTLARVTWSVYKPDYHLPFRNYPINKLRNIGIRQAATDYVLVIDADFVSDPALHDDLQQHVVPIMQAHERAGELFAYGVNCVALTEAATASPPKTLDRLREMMRTGEAYVTSRIGHGPSKIDILLDRPLWPTDGLGFYEVCFESQWEPYYVVNRHTAPLYDERFTNQGGDKQQHAMLLNAMGYRFRMLKGHFLYHLAHEPSMMWPGGGLRAGVTERTFNLFVDYIPEIEQQFGILARFPHCPHPFFTLPSTSV